MALAAAGLPVSRLAVQAVATLEEAIGWDGYRVFGLDARTLLINRLLAPSENVAGARLGWLHEVYLALPTPCAELPELARMGLRTVAFQERQDQCWGFPASQLSHIEPEAHYRYYHQFRSPVGGILLVIFRDQDRPVAAMQAAPDAVGDPTAKGNACSERSEPSSGTTTRAGARRRHWDAFSAASPPLMSSIDIAVSGDQDGAGTHIAIRARRDQLPSLLNPGHQRSEPS